MAATPRVLFLALAVSLSVVGSAPAAEHPTLPLGSKAPDFRLPGVDGKEYTLASFDAADVLVVIFTSNHCPTAQAYEGRINQFVADYAPRGVAVVAINPNHAPAVRLDEMGYTDLGDTFEEMKVRAVHRGFTFPYLDDGPAQATAEAYGPVATPHAFVFDRARVLRFHGRIDDAEGEAFVKVRDTRAAIDALLAGREPAVKSTKVFGCSIKWKDKAAGNAEWLARVAKEPVSLETADAATLAALRANGSGKVRLINVWATWCGPCVAEFPDLVETNLRFRGREFEMVTVAAEGPEMRVKVEAFLRKHHASTRNVIPSDPDKYKLIEAIDPEWSGALPYTLIVDPSGRVIHRATGGLDFLELRRILLPALDAVQPWPGLSGPG